VRDRPLSCQGLDSARPSASVGLLSRERAQIEIADLEPGDEHGILAVADILVESFKHIPGCLMTLEDAFVEVRASFGPGRISRKALDESGHPAGWVGGIEQYHGHAFELHPLAVRPSARGRGIGRALVADLEHQARERGAVMVYLGTDDEFGGTSLYGRNLYPDVLGSAARIRNLKSHPYEFYQKCGYVIVGLLPDANGIGMPDILMAKRL
jgi:aminoglycoside 6'-N-acetyltransferase I